jgi:hypothetical protein
MNDVKDAVDRIGERFSPSLGGLAELEGRRRRSGTRRRAATGVFALIVGVAGSALAWHAFLGPTDSHPRIDVLTAATSSTSASNGTADRGTCPAPSGESPPTVMLGSNSAAAGSSVDVSGSFQTGQAWVQLWWNAEDTERSVASPPWPPMGPDLRSGLDPKAPGPMTELASVAGPASGGDCSFKTTVTVPDVSPGRYQLLWVFGSAGGSMGQDGFALFTSPVTFEVAR